MIQPGISGNTRGRPKGNCGVSVQALAALDRHPRSMPTSDPDLCSPPTSVLKHFLTSPITPPSEARVRVPAVFDVPIVRNAHMIEVLLEMARRALGKGSSLNGELPCDLGDTKEGGI